MKERVIWMLVLGTLFLTFLGLYKERDRCNLYMQKYTELLKEKQDERKNRKYIKLVRNMGCE